MPDQDQLSTVVTAFQRWRSNRNGRQVPTPTTLREQTVSLLKNYSTSQITLALRISGGQLKQWRSAFESPDKVPKFVHLPISPTLTQPSVNVELRFTSGDKVSLSGVVVNSDMIASLIGAMRA